MHEPGEKGRGGRKGWELPGEEITKKGEGERGGDERCLLRRRLMHRCKEEGVGSGKRKGENSNYLLFSPPSSSLSLTASLPNHVSPDHHLDIVLSWIKRDGKQKGGEMIASKLVRIEWRATTLRLMRYLLGQSFLERREVQWVKTGTSGHPGQEKSYVLPVYPNSTLKRVSCVVRKRSYREEELTMIPVFPVLPPSFSPIPCALPRYDWETQRSQPPAGHPAFESPGP